MAEYRFCECSCECHYDWVLINEDDNVFMRIREGCLNIADTTKVCMECVADECEDND